MIHVYVCVGPSNKSGEQALLGLQRLPSVENFTVKLVMQNACKS